MTDVNVQLNELEAQIEALEAQREALAREHGIVIYGADQNASSTFFPSEEAFKEHFGYDDADMEWAAQEFSFPGWVSSSEMC